MQGDTLSHLQVGEHCVLDEWDVVDRVAASARDDLRGEKRAC